MNKFDTTVPHLRHGCLLGFIAHSISMSNGWVELEHTQGWVDRDTYSIYNCEGANGIIRFSEDACIGIVLDTHSDRYAEGQLNPDLYTKDAPEWVQIITREIAPRQYTDLDARDKGTDPAITGAFWGDSTGVFSCDIFDEFIESGGHVFQHHMALPTDAAAVFKEEYELSTNQALLLDIIYERKCEQKNEDIKLSQDEVALLGSNSAANKAATLRCFAQIGVTWAY